MKIQALCVMYFILKEAGSASWLPEAWLCETYVIFRAALHEHHVAHNIAAPIRSRFAQFSVS
jgi:hypothetical protein